MPIIFEMPTLSPTMEKGNLVSWCKNEGDEIAIGDVIAEVDTDKATMEVESVYKGKLERVLVAAGTHDVAVKTPIAIIRQKSDTDEDIAQAIAGINSREIPNQPEPPRPAPTRPPHNTRVGITQKASPLAKRLANELGINISDLSGTGPHGRIVKNDVINAKTPVNEPAYIDKPISSMRKIIAKKLTKAKQEIPHYYMSVKANVTSLLQLRKQLNDSGKLNTKITVNDLIVKAVANAMREVPEINVIWNNDTIRHFNNIDISIAVAIDGGLVTPVIKNANKKSLGQISQEIKDLSNRAKEKKLTPEEYNGGTLTISNLGMFGVNSFLSIINSPQSSILSIGATQKEVIINEYNFIHSADTLNIGYAIDHRVIDGAVAAKFLKQLKANLETPALIFL